MSQLPCPPVFVSSSPPSLTFQASPSNRTRHRFFHNHRLSFPSSLLNSTVLVAPPPLSSSPPTLHPPPWLPLTNFSIVSVSASCARCLSPTKPRGKN
ncbi:hypothetical protein Bca4012_018181 [Brassica carinata]